MKRNLLLLSAAFALLISTEISAQGWWFKKADYNQSPRTASVAFVISTGAFVGTGYDSTSFRRNFSAYNQVSNTWTPITSLGGSTGSGLSRNAAIAFSIGTKGYVGLGQGSNPYLNDLWEYDAGSDAWTQKANFPPGGRRSAVAFSSGTKGYVTCGQEITGFKNDTWEYNPAGNTWTAKAAFPGTPRRLPVAFVVGSNAFVGTGDDGVFKSDFYKYSITTNAWVAITAFPGTPRYGATAFAISNDGYVGTGYDNTLENTKTFYKYNTVTGMWSAVKDFSGTGRANAAGFAIGSFGFVTTGYDSLPTNDLWLYDPVSNGVEEMEAFRSSVKVYPNPMQEQATISFDASSLNAFGKISFEMLDLNGRVVKKIDAISSSEYTFDRDGLASGLYVYRFSGDGRALAAGKMILQ
jgi:hypothetical protein